ncbi:MAG: ATP-binding protein [Candidatus Aminicenantes bacterium]|nr:ATP-binding protein [Candidatus Aminicenantes bacterium]
MKPALMKHNPAFLSRDELIKSFVVRQVDLDLIIETIKENTGNSNQHVLIIAPRGMGKTTLVLRAMATIAEDKELNSQWYSIVFSEESYEVFTAAEFWLRAIFHLARQTKNETLAQAHERLKTEKDEKRLYERALSFLMDFADEQGKRLLLVVENVNMLFDEQIGSDDSWDIRHTLLNEPRIMLLGTATSRFDGIDNAGKAMFDLFKIHYLEPLATQESKLLWEYLTGEEVKENKIRPIHILTGGNPRLLAIISSFAVGASFRELMKQLTSLIDEYTTYFKSNIESLPALERKVFVTLANIWEPADSARVARDARIDVNKTSSLLKRLEFRGCVSALKSAGRKKSYQVTERLYNIYHLMRLSGSQSDRVRAVVDFMINFYEGDALAKKLAELTEDACYLDPEERKDHLAVEKALSVAVDFLKDPSSAKKFPNDIISFFTDAAAAGCAKEGLKLLKDSACAPYMEPLIVALQMLAGEEYNAPQEVVEVAKDVLERIKEKKAKPACHENSR